MTSSNPPKNLGRISSPIQPKQPRYSSLLAFVCLAPVLNQNHWMFFFFGIMTFPFTRKISHQCRYIYHTWIYHIYIIIYIYTWILWDQKNHANISTTETSLQRRREKPTKVEPTNLQMLKSCFRFNPWHIHGTNGLFPYPFNQRLLSSPPTFGDQVWVTLIESPGSQVFVGFPSKTPSNKNPFWSFFPLLKKNISINTTPIGILKGKPFGHRKAATSFFRIFLYW